VEEIVKISLTKPNTFVIRPRGFNVRHTTCDRLHKPRLPGTCVTEPVVNSNQEQMTMTGCLGLEGFETMAAGEPQQRWPEWLTHIPTVYYEFDFSRPYSYVVLPQDTL
jgi:hypothetical protein